MKLDVAKDDLQTLRSEAHECYTRLEGFLARGGFPSAIEPRRLVLAKFIRKLNRALVKAFGHDCNAQAYPITGENG